MNNLFSSSFFEDVESIKDELRDLERIQRSLHDANEGGKSLHDAARCRAAGAHGRRRRRRHQEGQGGEAPPRVARPAPTPANRSVPGCGPGSSTDRTRTSVVAGLRKKLRDSMESFSSLRARISSEYRETVARRYYTVTGEQPDEATLDNLAETGEGERFLQRAIAEQGRGEVLGVVAEIQERHGAVAELERSLLELHQVFNDMAVLVAAQGEQLDDIETHVGRARSFVDRGREQLVVARKHQKSTRKWTCIAIIILLVLILVVVLPIVLKFVNNNKSSSSSPAPATPSPPPPTA
ncbi:hypothetical protein OsJ_12868 [Oryza sativa Japonica Group]|uniref:t-SNARE coiled-coil homology domain-containing protein n=1 Tax=Oryza sativa subsp. japonica TaxID=39947 RepID=B9F6D1_ORYSJ|nr:hypothetical protein OsJ_12868 [Oryza sativa Japonica Group]